MTLAVTLQRLRASLTKSAGTVVFGMEDGTVSIFGLIFGVAATTTSTQAVVIAGASGAVAAAVSMMAGVYLDAAPEESSNPWEQSLWMLLADFAAAAVPIVPFVLLPIPQARVVSGVVTLLLLIGLGVGRARVAKRDTLRTILETVAIGIAAALAGVGISVLIDHGFGG